MLKKQYETDKMTKLIDKLYHLEQFILAASQVMNKAVHYARLCETYSYFSQKF